MLLANQRKFQQGFYLLACRILYRKSCVAISGLFPCLKSFYGSVKIFFIKVVTLLFIKNYKIFEGADGRDVGF
jgi:hypothetical protein